MNSLSWFLYFADIIPSIGKFFVTSSIIGAIFVALHTLGIAIHNDCYHNKALYLRKRWIVLVFVCGLIPTIIPSKNTLYAIAASELGQSAMESKMGTKAMQAIESWIASQIHKVANKKD